MSWLKAGIEMFSLKGEGTVILGNRKLVTVQRVEEFSLNLSAAGEGSPCLPDVSSILDSSASGLQAHMCHAVMETVFLGIHLHSHKASNTQVFQIQNLESDRE